MPRTDRLFDLAARLRDGRLHRAEDLARDCGVSVRTIYRDMDTLIASGVPIAGERGYGYTITAEVTLPPLNLTAEERDALMIGLAAVAQAGDGPLAEAGAGLWARIEALLPDGLPASGRAGLAIGPYARVAAAFQHLPVLRAAIRARQKLAVQAEDGATDVLRPLGLDYWGRVWRLVAWSDTTGGFRDLRIDRLTEVRPLPQLFQDEPGRRLADFRRDQTGA